MAINLKLQLASGQSLKGAPLELLLNGARSPGPTWMNTAT